VGLLDGIFFFSFGEIMSQPGTMEKGIGKKRRTNTEDSLSSKKSYGSIKSTSNDTVKEDQTLSSEHVNGSQDQQDNYDEEISIQDLIGFDDTHSPPGSARSNGGEEMGQSEELQHKLPHSFTIPSANHPHSLSSTPNDFTFL
jgi:hypothetical protein